MAKALNLNRYEFNYLKAPTLRGLRVLQPETWHSTTLSLASVPFSARSFVERRRLSGANQGCLALRIVDHGTYKTFRVVVRLVHIVTVPDSLLFLRGQCAYMAAEGHDVTVVSSPDERLADFARREGVRWVGVPMRRAITPVADTMALLRLAWRLWRLRPDVVHAHTPKGGLLGMMAAWLARVPGRIYHIHGLPFETATGLRRPSSCQVGTGVVPVGDAGIVRQPLSPSSRRERGRLSAREGRSSPLRQHQRRRF